MEKKSFPNTFIYERKKKTSQYKKSTDPQNYTVEI